MIDTGIQTQPPPEAATTRPRPAALEAAAVEAPPPSSSADVIEPVAPAADAADAPPPASEPSPAPARRDRRGTSTAAVTAPWESALPGVRSSEIRAELARREHRAAELLAEREQLVAEMDAIEAALDAFGEDAP